MTTKKVCLAVRLCASSINGKFKKNYRSHKCQIVAKKKSNELYEGETIQLSPMQKSWEILAMCVMQSF